MAVEQVGVPRHFGLELHLKDQTQCNNNGSSSQSRDTSSLPRYWCDIEGLCLTSGAINYLMATN